MDSRNSSVTSPPLCARGCGFYGTAENRNMCSKCYNNFLKEEIIAKTRSADTSPPSATKAAPTIMDEQVDDTHQSLSTKIETFNIKEEAAPSPAVKNRCENCNKKVGFTGFACRCGKVFCGTHRYPEEHSCTFDFKKSDRDLLIKQNPLIMGDKMDSRV